MAVSFSRYQSSILPRRVGADPEFSDSIANIAKFDEAVADLPCENILGLVIYDLPGRDCAAKASNGELSYSEISKYKTSYIDRKRILSL